MLIALTIGSLSQTIDKEGGPYAYCHEILGLFMGFLVGWGLWISFWVAIASGGVAFAGYASSIFPVIESNTVLRTLLSMSLVWALGATFIFGGVKGKGVTQLVTTVAMLLPLLLIPGLGFLYGEQTVGLSVEIETNQGTLETIAKMVLLTMWPFIGIEMATIPAKETINPKHTIPKALFFGLLSVTFVYLFATLGIWSAIPINELSQSASPFADVAEMFLGPVGATFIALGVMISIAGSVNGCFLASVILPQSMADDGLFPHLFSDKNRFGTSWKSLLVALTLVTAVLLMNTSDQLVGIYEFLIILSTLTAILPYALCAIADMVLQLKSGETVKPLSFVRALGALVFSTCMVLGAGVESIIYGVILLIAGVPIFLVFRTRLERSVDFT